MLYFVIGIIIGGGGVYLILSRLGSKAPNGISIDSSAIDEDLAAKHRNLTKIKELIATKDKITNNEVQKLLGISDATATRYLDDLEKEGVIRQVGKVGYQVYYEKV